MANSLDDAAKAKNESDALAKHNKATDDLAAFFISAPSTA